MRWVVCIAALGACGRIGFEPGLEGGELGPFGVPTAVTALNASGADDYGPTVTADVLEITFTSDRSGQFKLYSATRTSTAEMFSAPVVIAASDQAGIEYDAELSEEGTEMFFHGEAAPAGIWRMTRASRQDAWMPPVVVAGLADYEGPQLFAGDLRMLVSRRGGGIDEFARTTLADPWVMQPAHTALAGQKWPGVSADGREVFVASTSERLSRATRALLSEPFGSLAPVVLGDPWDSYNIVDPELSSDARLMFLSIDVGAGRFELYVLVR